MPKGQFARWWSKLTEDEKTDAVLEVLADSLPESPPIEDDPVAIRLGLVPPKDER